MDIDSLPLETFLEILKRVDGLTLGKCRRVSKRWMDIVDSTDLLWQYNCEKEFKAASGLAKRKCGNDCRWYHVYKNFKMWGTIDKSEKTLEHFLKFNIPDDNNPLEVDYSLLPLREAKGVVIYCMTLLRTIPVAFCDRDCIKMCNNDTTTALLTKSGLLLQRSDINPVFMTENFLKADNFVMSEKAIYFFHNRDVFKVDLSLELLLPKYILHCDNDIKTIQCTDEKLYIFTDFATIVTLNKDVTVSTKAIDIPTERVRYMKQIDVLDDNNFICYSEKIFLIETEKYQHLYLDFPPFTAVFFYGDYIILGTKAGEILLYQMSLQKQAGKPIFRTLAKLPDKKFAVKLDICERPSGPLIIASTYLEMFLLDINFFPHEETPATLTSLKVRMYKRLLKLRSRLYTIQQRKRTAVFLN